FLIRTIDTTAAGREIVRDRTIGQPSLTVGRAAENDIHLADLAVEQSHIRIDLKGAKVTVEAVGTLGFSLDGRSVMSADIDPATGAEIELGSSLLTLARDGAGPDAGPVSITIKQAAEKGAKVDTVAGFALASALPSKRAMAWAASLAILVLLLSVPIFTHLTRDTSGEGRGPDAPMIDQVSFDSTWSSGDLSLAHHDLKDNCEACHATPFVSVQDNTCLTCHEELGEHAAQPRLMEGMAPIPAGEAWQWAVAETLGKEGPGSCTSCHLEHEGKVRQQAATQEFCADCHEALDGRLSDVAFGNAANFGDKHPQFRPTFYTAHGQDEPVRVSLDERIEEKSGLVFPHDIHMSEDGGVARMAISLDGYDGPLECADCHALTEDKIGFKPVEMEPSCEGCHSLVSGRDATGFTTLRHGDVDDLMEDLANLGNAPKRAVVTGRGRPGQFAAGGAYAINFGRPTRSLIAINRALLPGGTCGDCHIPTQTGGRPDLIPVNLPDRYMQHGFFSHEAHEDEECTDCHEATTSEAATDLLLPDLASCQDCHIGEVVAPPGITMASLVKDDEVPSTCAMCHGYHTPTNPWPGDHPILQSTPEGIRGRSEDTIASISAMLEE
ncbi:MAG: cytochrome c3 family protein, partial [Pseudomonadota bacterium]